MNSSVNLHKPEEKHIPVLAKEQSEDQPVVLKNERVACSPSASAQLECLRGAKLRPQCCLCCSYLNSFSMSRISWTLHIPCHSAETVQCLDYPRLGHWIQHPIPLLLCSFTMSTISAQVRALRYHNHRAPQNTYRNATPLCG